MEVVHGWLGVVLRFHVFGAHTPYTNNASLLHGGILPVHLIADT
jgi:hypothetical protein